MAPVTRKTPRASAVLIIMLVELLTHSLGQESKENGQIFYDHPRQQYDNSEQKSVLYTELLHELIGAHLRISAVHVL